MSSRVALIIIGTFKEEWWGLAPVAQADFVSRVGSISQAAGLEPQTGYRLTATPGAFLEVWEGPDRTSVEQAVRELQAMGYTRYIDARWLIGEREVKEPAVQASRPTRNTKIRRKKNENTVRKRM
jgi:hypothetical protein